MSIGTLFPACFLLLSALGFFWGQSVHAGYLPASFLAAVLVTYYLYRPRLRRLLIVVVVLLGLLSMGQWLARHTIDLAYDSRAYHLPAIIALSHGWNPFSDPDVCRWSPIYCLPNSILSSSYPKATWLMASGFYTLTGNVETGKVYNQIACLMSLIACFTFFLRARYLPAWQSLLISICIALNPVSIKQLSSNAVDGIMASFMVLLFVLSLDFVFHRRSQSLLLAGCALLFAINIKFTGLVYGFIIAAGVLSIGWWRDNRVPWTLVRTWLVSGVLAVVVAGYNPYVTNTIAYQNPFYPATGSGQDVLGGMAAAEFLQRSRLEEIAVSLFSRPSPDNSMVPVWYTPFLGLRVTSQVDERFSGFGEPFAAALLLSALLLVFVRNRACIAVVGITVMSILATAAGWWARLAPQTWWVPTLVALDMLPPSPRRAAPLRVLAWGVVTILLLTSLTTYAIVLKDNYRYSAAYNQLLTAMQGKRVVVLPAADDKNNGATAYRVDSEAYDPS